MESNRECQGMPTSRDPLFGNSNFFSAGTEPICNCIGIEAKGNYRGGGTEVDQTRPGALGPRRPREVFGAPEQPWNGAEP